MPAGRSRKDGSGGGARRLDRKEEGKKGKERKEKKGELDATTLNLLGGEELRS